MVFPRGSVLVAAFLLFRVLFRAFVNTKVHEFTKQVQVLQLVHVHSNYLFSKHFFQNIFSKHFVKAFVKAFFNNKNLHFSKKSALRGQGGSRYKTRPL